jgi:putative heme-binding domain-containing protein
MRYRSEVSMNGLARAARRLRGGRPGLNVRPRLRLAARRGVGLGDGASGGSSVLEGAMAAGAKLERFSGVRGAGPPRSRWPASRRPTTSRFVVNDLVRGKGVFGETPKTTVETTALPQSNCIVAAKGRLAIRAGLSGLWGLLAWGGLLATGNLVNGMRAFAGFPRCLLAGFLLLAGAAGLVAEDVGADDFALVDPQLKLVKIDSDEKESLLALAADGMGRIFAGGREGLFVYEPDPRGLYLARRELYRFPSNSWVYNIAIRGRDLYVLTVAALYVFPDGVVRREGLQPKRLLWGCPVAHVHQGLHGMTFGPDGDLYISTGDQAWYYGNFSSRPDHWGHWNLYHGPDSAAMPYTGAGGVLRLSPDGKELAVVANGTRNDCGLAFDTYWNLFGNDNDHESMPKEYVPGRLLHITPGAYFNWPRGWMPEKQPWRFDLLETMTPNLGRDVPVGMCYYDDDFLPEKYRHCLYVARWGNHSIPRCPIDPAGDTFQTEERPFLTGKNQARPLNVIVGRGGRLFAIICYMAQNEESPVYRSDLVMITRRDDAANAPFRAVDPTQATLGQLMKELGTASWSRRFAAHVELTRRGAESLRAAAQKLDARKANAPATPHLIWLAAASESSGARSKIIAFAEHPSSVIRSLAMRALARFGAGAQAQEVFSRGLKDADPQVRLAALTGFFDQANEFPFESVLNTATSTLDGLSSNSKGTYLRQTAGFLLARRASLQQLSALCEDAEVKRRMMGVLAAGFRLTIPRWDQPLDKSLQLDEGMSQGDIVTYAGGVREDLRQRGPMGIFTIADAWGAGARSDEQETLFALLQHRLADADEKVARQAAFFLRLLDDARSEQAAAAVLGLGPHAAQNGAPLTNAASTGATELPAAYRNLDWAREVLKGDPKKGQELFATRGCATCHSIRDRDAGSGGPSLKGAASRFSLAYIAESIIVPNKSVSPIYRWTLLKLKNGEETSGLITGETATEVEVLLPSAVRHTIKKNEIAVRELQNRSPMPEGLIQTPAELCDLLAFFLAQKEPAGSSPASK